MKNRPAWLFTQAAGLPYFRQGDQTRVVLVTSRSGKKWIFPKGVIDPGETAESTAVNEAREEAGVVGRVTGVPLGAYEQAKWGGVAQIDVLPLLCTRLLDSWEEQSARTRLVLSLDEAATQIFEPLRPILGELERSLASGVLPLEPLA